MKRAWMTACMPALLLCLACPGASARQPKPQTTDIAADAYVYGFPLVLMKFTREQGKLFGYQTNCFHHDRSLKGPANLGVVHPNNDTLYSASFLDLTAEPMVLHVPDTTGRYFMMQMLDAWTNTFACPGSRTTGTAAQDFIIAGPDWRGPLRGPTPVLRCPTNLAWIIGRTEVQGEADLPLVHAIQDGYTLTPLSVWLQGGPSPCGPPTPGPGAAITPLQRLQSLSAVEFLQVLSDLMRESPAPGWDRPALERFEKIGFTPGRPFTPPEVMQADINAAKAPAEARIAAGWRAIPELVNGWGIILTEIGTFGTDYTKRAAVARYGLGANLLDDAIYPSAYKDVNGEFLDASIHGYRIHFEAGQTPPVSGFWSITLYNGDYFFANDEFRYAIHGTDPLYFDPDDNSLDLYIQRDPPDDPLLRANWLPAPDGPFNVTLRMYWPDKQAIKGQWLPAPIVPYLDLPPEGSIAQ